MMAAVGAAVPKLGARLGTGELLGAHKPGVLRQMWHSPEHVGRCRDYMATL